MLDENFHPVRHLVEKHRYTSFHDLKVGLVNLKREVELSNQAPVHFMRDNLDAFLQCYDTLSDILYYPSARVLCVESMCGYSTSHRACPHDVYVVITWVSQKWFILMLVNSCIYVHSWLGSLLAHFYFLDSGFLHM